MTATKTRTGRKNRKPSAANEQRRAEVELAVAAFDEEHEQTWPEFAARWSDRYDPRYGNLQRLWVQTCDWPAPATQLHTFGGWHRYGRHVRAGAKALWLKLPRTRHDEDKVSASNPDGTVFTGASWTPLWDWSQTVDIDDFDEDPDAVADPGQVAEVKRLRAAALKLHPDTTGDSSQDAARAFSAAWDRYETAKARLTEGTRSR